MLSRLTSVLLAVMVVAFGIVQAKPFSVRRADYNYLRSMQQPHDHESELRLFVPAYTEARNGRLHNSDGQAYFPPSPPQASDYEGYGPTGAKRAHLLRLANQAARGFGK